MEAGNSNVAVRKKLTFDKSQEDEEDDDEDEASWFRCSSGDIQLEQLTHADPHHLQQTLAKGHLQSIH